MGNVNKEEIYQNFKIKKQTESSIIRNPSISLPFGKENIELRELPWLEAEAFEKKLIEIVDSLVDSLAQEIDTDNLKNNISNNAITKFLTILLNNILNKDLLDLVYILTRQKASLEYIIEKEATKNQIIQIAIEGLKINYSYAKNLITLARNLFVSK